VFQNSDNLVKFLISSGHLPLPPIKAVPDELVMPATTEWPQFWRGGIQ